MVVIEVRDDSRRPDAGKWITDRRVWWVSVDADVGAVRVDINFIARGRFLLLRCAQMH